MKIFGNIIQLSVVEVAITIIILGTVYIIWEVLMAL